MSKSQVSPAKKRAKGAPEWALNPFNHFLDETERLSRVVHISSRGIRMLQSTPKIVEVLMKIDEDDSTEASQRLESARKEAQFAKREVESGFPVLHAWAVVGLWALMEALIRIFVAQWLKHKRSSWQTESIRRLRIRLGEYEGVPRNQRHLFVVELLERELGAGIKNGVSRFEVMIEPFGLSGELPDTLRKTIFELGQVRNVIAHSVSKVDRRFIDACPWLGAKVGEELRISAEMFERYNLAAEAYVTLLVCRIGEHFGVNMAEERTSVEEGLERYLPNQSLQPK